MVSKYYAVVISK